MAMSIQKPGIFKGFLIYIRAQNSSSINFRPEISLYISLTLMASYFSADLYGAKLIFDVVQIQYGRRA